LLSRKQSSPTELELQPRLLSSVEIDNAGLTRCDRGGHIVSRGALDTALFDAARWRCELDLQSQVAAEASELLVLQPMSAAQDALYGSLGVVEDRRAR
jgi:hypothetical protein